MAARQIRLFCMDCGDLPVLAGRCRPCYSRLAHSRRCFAGLREEVLERDGHRCRVCGGPDRLAVHHRQPGVNAPDLLITVCARCHARLHRLAAIRLWLPEPLAVLWTEQHPGVPVQLQLELAAAA